mmetsp:Transcript_63278/g.177024  ORF Transcript_63278/g.177024 Transcript_63278/m.177024 type:complete len:223 (+) Transcript_63278:1285-1953(+)
MGLLRVDPRSDAPRSPPSRLRMAVSGSGSVLQICSMSSWKEFDATTQLLAMSAAMRTMKPMELSSKSFPWCSKVIGAETMKSSQYFSNHFFQMRHSLAIMGYCADMEWNMFAQPSAKRSGREEHVASSSKSIDEICPVRNSGARLSKFASCPVASMVSRVLATTSVGSPRLKSLRMGINASFRDWASSISKAGSCEKAMAENMRLLWQFTCLEGMKPCSPKG